MSKAQYAYKKTRDHLKNLENSCMIVIMYLFVYFFPVTLLISDFCIHKNNQFRGKILIEMQIHSK